MESLKNSPTNNSLKDTTNIDIKTIKTNKQNIKENIKIPKKMEEISKINKKLISLNIKKKNLKEFKKFISIYKFNFNEINLEIFNKNKVYLTSISNFDNMDNKFYINKLNSKDIVRYINLISLNETFFNLYGKEEIKLYHIKMIQLTSIELKTLFNFQ